jgi:NADPH:quinone reductase-like Zn-dependent oxidoreductase
MTTGLQRTSTQLPDRESRLTTSIIASGETVLITAGAGAIGHLAVQLARGARTCRWIESTSTAVAASEITLAAIRPVPRLAAVIPGTIAAEFVVTVS